MPEETMLPRTCSGFKTIDRVVQAWNFGASVVVSTETLINGASRSRKLILLTQADKLKKYYQNKKYLSILVSESFCLVNIYPELKIYEEVL